MLLTLANVV